MASGLVPPLSSYSTALVVLPPAHIQLLINPLRSANDKSFPRWTSHITLVFPFVEPSCLPQASALIKDALAKAKLSPFSFQLDQVGKFKQRHYTTVFLGPSRGADIGHVWKIVSSAVGYIGRPFVPHLTLGQARYNEGTLAFLEDKGRRLLSANISWDLCSVVILHKSDTEGGLMKIYEEIPLSISELRPSPTEALVNLHPAAYRFLSNCWTLLISTKLQELPDSVTLTTYNILCDTNHPIAPRASRLLSNILSLDPVPSLICLQEVTDDFLRYFLAVPEIQARWPYCTHDPASVLPVERNIVFLGQDSLPFEWEYIHLRGKRKPALVLRIPGARTDDGAPSLIVVGVHLTAGLTLSQRNSKLDELDTLVRWLYHRHPDSPWILIGDFNILTTQPIPQSIMAAFDDAWLVARGSESGGATYNPDTNTLASRTVKKDRAPQRYDRIWIRRGMNIEVQTMDIFGQGMEEASDHYGLTTTLLLSSPKHVNVELNQGWGGILSISQLDDCGSTRGVATSSVEELENFVRKEGGFPSETQWTDRDHAITALRAVLSPPIQPDSPQANLQTPEGPSAVTQLQHAVKFEITPVGSFALRADTQSSDIDVLVVGNIPPRTFWTLARTRIRKAASKVHPSNKGPVHKEVNSEVVLKRFVKDASVQMMELLVGGVHVDMQYCSAGTLLESWKQIHVLPPTDSRFLLPVPSLRTLNAYRDLQHILRILPTPILPAFRLAHRALKLFCIAQGIYSSRLGYLGGIHITLLLSRVATLSSPNSSASELIATFFASYSEWDWEQQMVTVAGSNGPIIYNRTPTREPMVILSVERPVTNVVQNANKHTTNAIVSTLKMAHGHLIKGAAWADVCGSGGVCGDKFRKGFLHSHDSFVQISMSFWGHRAAKARACFGYIESRLPHLLVLFQTKLPSWSVRLWPSRLIDANNPGDMSTGLQCFYLIGINKSAETSSGNGIQTLLSTFEDQLRQNERYYDAKETFVSVMRVSLSQLPQMITPPLAWNDGGIDPDDEASDEDRDVDSWNEEHDPDTAFTPISAKQLKKRRQQPKAGDTYTPAAKLRTSLDVFNRLLWDRNFQHEEYLIGYEDRFDGLKEIPLANWKREVEDEAFVPFHRIVHFRRKRDSMVVWDRRKKIDRVFGSGISIAEHDFQAA